MNNKIISIGILTLFIATALVSAVGTMNNERPYRSSTLAGPTLEWEYISGGPYEDQFLGVDETEDGGYIVTGVTENPEGVFSGIVVKLDNLGNEQWRNIETEVQGSELYNFGITEVYQTHDGGYIVCGACDRYEAGDLQAGFLWKLNADGDTEWFNSAYSGSHQGNWYLVVTWDVMPVVNGYLIAGDAWYAEDAYGIDVDAIMMKTDLNGDVINGSSVAECVWNDPETPGCDLYREIDNIR